MKNFSRSEYQSKCTQLQSIMPPDRCLLIKCLYEVCLQQVDAALYNSWSCLNSSFVRRLWYLEHLYNSLLTCLKLKAIYAAVVSYGRHN